jgi:hypothetical protein
MRLHLAALAACAVTAAAAAAAGCTADEDCLGASLRCLPDPLGTPCVLDESMCSTGEVAALDSNWCED